MIFEDGTIFFGTRYNNIYQLDKKGIDKPFQHEEQYLSVSSSGYYGIVSCFEHEDLKFLSDVYSNHLHAATINTDGFIKWKEGYKNSLTYHDGFGPCDLKKINCFGKSVENTRVGENVCAVIHNSKKRCFVIPEKPKDKNELPFEYLSLALHPFLKYIDPEMIIGWIVDSKNCNKIQNDMRLKHISQKDVWLVEEL